MRTQVKPIPWHITNGVEIRSADGGLVCTVEWAEEPEGLEATSKAALIIRAVNAHDKLVEALRRISNNAEARVWNSESEGVDWEAFKSILAEARTALTLAEGGKGV